MNNIKKHKITCAIIALIIFFGLVVSIPSLAKLKNRNTIYTVSSWDGTVATSYRKGDGTQENPYIISNGSEFAFFIQQLKDTDYEGLYFELGNDIIINSGIFEYDETDGLKYILDDMTYYLKEYTNEYYDNVNREGISLGTINTTSMIKNFKGNLNGKSFTIFGLQITDSTKENLALFENLEGNITDLYIKNSVVYGVGDVAGIAVNTKDSTLKNTVYDGIVVNKSLTKINLSNIDPISITTTNAETITNLVLPQVTIEGGIKSIKLVGEYTSSSEEASNIIKINGVDILENNFEVDLSLNELTEIPISTTSTIEGTTLNFSNLEYRIEYYDDITSGFISNSTNTSLNNVITKADVYGNYISAGFVGKVNESLQITQGYNTGNITSGYIASGIVGVIKNNINHTTITNVYNKGIITASNSGAILGVISENTGLININNSINISSNYAINSIINSTVNIVNSYSTNGLTAYNGILETTFTQTALENLYLRDFMTNNSYNEFVSLVDIETNLENVWIYEKESLPILYIDDLNNPIANINIGKYSWNNLSSELSIIGINPSITFNIQDVSATNPVKEKYYYITNSRVALTKEELDKITTWISYEDIVTIDESGYYVIYAKIVDMDDKITYINTDIMALDVSGFQTNISMGDKTWSEFKTKLEKIYTDQDINLTIFAHDDLIEIASVDYYISNKELTLDEVSNITEWVSYSNYITINQTGNYVIYARIIDSESTIRYVNTDYLIYNGYKGTINIGNSNTNYETNYITNKSSLKLTFESDFEITYLDGYTHNLISSILLPKGTKITLIDKATNKVYRKNIDTSEDLYGYNDSCAGVTNCSKYATYGFELFKEMGTTNVVAYDESLNYNKTITNEKYVIIIDFEETDLVENYYDISFYLAIKDSNGDYLFKTISNTINSVNIYSIINDSDVLTTHSITSDYANQIIYFNSDSETSINLTNLVTYSNINNKNIIDTTYENKKSGILIRLYDKDGALINRRYLDNMLFEINGIEYFASNDNSIKINLGSVVDNQNKVLKIKTKENSSGLANGTYYIKINKFISDDGYYYDSLYEDVIEIPLVVENQTFEIPNYSFSVNMTTESVILDKKQDTHLVSFDIFYSGNFMDPNIRVSLYEKNDLTAYNQNYTLIDIAQYVTNELIVADENKYFVDTLSPTLTLNLMPNKFNNNGYKYVFELYDGTRKISKIEKYFIVK